MKLVALLLKIIKFLLQQEKNLFKVAIMASDVKSETNSPSYYIEENSYINFLICALFLAFIFYFGWSA